jgi:hypothetical protein
MMSDSHAAPAVSAVGYTGCFARLGHFGAAASFIRCSLLGRLAPLARRRFEPASRSSRLFRGYIRFALMPN